MQDTFRVTNLRLAEFPDGADLVVTDGVITEIGSPGQLHAGTSFDAGGGIALPGLIDAHTHLDKSLEGARWVSLPPTATVHERAAVGEDIVLGIDTPSLEARAEALARRALSFGTVAARSHADVSPGLGLRAVEASLAVRERLAGVMDLEIVAFPQRGTSDPATATLLDAALELGCSVIGGLDPAGFDNDVDGQLRLIFGLAVRHRAAVDIHLHDRGERGQDELMRICEMTVADGLGGRVAISHAFCLGDLDASQLSRSLERLREAGVAIITAASPAFPMPPASQLWAHGVGLGLGTDTAQSWSPYGTGDILDRASLFAARSDFRTSDGLLRTLDMVTSDNARLMGMAPATLAEGSPARFVVVDARSIEEAVAAHGRRLLVVSGSQVVPIGTRS